ncbi:hypothetical protein C8R44DRAFT_807854 [Mycena epipterygia]|nr:hypothetical protein C8R44DRAFT_807854 [Mycena epipterygia]
MGPKIFARLSASGAGTILTNLKGRSDATRQRVKEAGMQYGSYAEIVERATCVFSVVPPKDALAVAEATADAYKAANTQRQIILADCNAVNPDSVNWMAAGAPL